MPVELAAITQLQIDLWSWSAVLVLLAAAGLALVEIQIRLWKPLAPYVKPDISEVRSGGISSRVSFFAWGMVNSPMYRIFRFLFVIAAVIGFLIAIVALFA